MLKTIIDKTRWLYVGFILGAWFVSWAWSESDKQLTRSN